LFHTMQRQQPFRHRPVQPLFDWLLVALHWCRTGRDGGLVYYLIISFSLSFSSSSSQLHALLHVVYIIQKTKKGTLWPCHRIISNAAPAGHDKYNQVIKHGRKKNGRLSRKMIIFIFYFYFIFWKKNGKQRKNIIRILFSKWWDIY
jgi:hypothetical protein